MSDLGRIPLLAHGLASAGPGLFDAAQNPLPKIGWAGFLDTHFLLDSLAALALATVLGAVVGYHPTMRKTVDTLAEANMPKVYILYAFIGAVIGVTVLEFGMVIGVVVFGIGGLIRFRSETDSTRDTGRLIVVTLIGLIAGLGLPHLAALTTLFAFVLIWWFDSRPVYQIKVNDLPEGRLAECGRIYREALKGLGCSIISERRHETKERLIYVLRLPRKATRGTIHDALRALPSDVCGDIEWEID
jgi:hypothetical protein